VEHLRRVVPYHVGGQGDAKLSSTPVLRHHYGAEMKGKAKQVRIPNKNSKPKSTDTLTTSKGITVRIVGVSQLWLDKLRTAVKFPDPPKYSVTTVTGDVEYHSHDETTLETDEDRRLWAEYQAETAKAEFRRNEMITKYVLTKGVEVDIPDSGEWIDMNAFLGIDLPTNPIERKYEYVRSEVVGTAEDLAEIISKVMELSGVPQEALEEAKASFRDLLEGEDPTQESSSEEE
jgi:hypothetical protein